MKIYLLSAFTALLSIFLVVQAEEPNPAKTPQKAAKAIKALLITGGCCHDYANQKNIIPKGVSERANVEWTVVHQGGKTTDTKIPLHKNPDWAKGYDVVVHNECFAFVTDKPFVEGIIKPHAEGVPAVMIHCAMHNYRVWKEKDHADWDEWFKLTGADTRGHGPKTPVTYKTVKQDHPVTVGLDAEWNTHKGELYTIKKIYENSTVLIEGDNGKAKHPVSWVNTFGKARVFSTTIGHYNHTMEQPEFLDMLTSGLLWTCDKINEDGTPKDGFGPVDTKKTSATSEPSFHNFTVKTIDGKDKSLKDYEGKVVLAVNVASRCGNTRQYKNLVALDQQFADKDFAILALPANNYGGQEPGTEAEIKEFCSSKFGVSFDMTSKVSTKGDDQHPVFGYLTDETKTGVKGGDIKWNFEKFLIGKDGKLISRYSSREAPDGTKVVSDINKALEK